MYLIQYMQIIHCLMSLHDLEYSLPAPVTPGLAELY
jgi:hypothetical protein